MLLMSYLNPILAYGPERFVEDVQAAGADGLIVPDLPPEEAGMLAPPCAAAGLALVFMLAPTSSPERIRLVAARTTGFIYAVSLIGVTGARAALPPTWRTSSPACGPNRQTAGPRLRDRWAGAGPAGQPADGWLHRGQRPGRAGADGPGAVRDLAASLRAALD